MIKSKHCNHTKGSKFRGDTEPVEFWGRVWEGVSPFPLTQGVFAFWGLKVCDLMHTFGKFVGILSIPKLIGGDDRGGRVWEGVFPLPYQGFFAFWGVQNKRSGAYFG